MSDLGEDQVTLAEAAEGTKKSLDSERKNRAKELVDSLLAEVSEQDRVLLLLKEVEGHSVEELASMTGMNENTIKVKLFRARQKLVKAAQRLGRLPGRLALGQ